MTQTNISIEKRQNIKSVVAEACIHFNRPKLPFEIKALVRSYPNIKLIAYSKHIKRLGVSYEYITSIAKDAYTDYYADANLYYIYYNDLDYNIVNSNRYRWNIAHELGHVLLHHLENNNKTRILRSNLSDKEYDELEEEADYFAQLILVPHATLLGFRIDSPKNIRIMCKISTPAAKRRYYEYIEWKRHIDAQDEYDNRIFRYYYKFIFKRKCKNCGAALIQRHGKYCPICGKKNILEWGDGNMIYPKLDTNEDGKLTECPTCNNEEIAIDGAYCHICGTNLINHCTNNDCLDYLPSNARYCPICGGYSSFYQNGILKSWNYSDSNRFMDIPDGIDEELPFN